jgi:hypothetical protein
MSNLVWIKSTANEGLQFETFTNLSQVNANGVHVIWHGGPKPWTVRVGQGNVCERLTAHRVDSAISAYRPLGLFVTWATVPSYEKDGVERFLADELRPLIGDRHPDVRPIPVNLPWAA